MLEQVIGAFDGTPASRPAAHGGPAGWELVLLAVGFGLIAYGAVDRERGPGVPRRASSSSLFVVDRRAAGARRRLADRLADRCCSLLGGAGCWPPGCGRRRAAAARAGRRRAAAADAAHRDEPTAVRRAR